MNTILDTASQNCNLENTLNSFSFLKQKKVGYSAQCPSCASISKDTTKNNLFLVESTCKNGLPKLAIKCHAGCDAKSILAAVNLTFADLYTQSPGYKSKSNSSILSTNSYTFNKTINNYNDNIEQAKIAANVADIDTSILVKRVENALAANEAVEPNLLLIHSIYTKKENYKLVAAKFEEQNAPKDLPLVVSFGTLHKAESAAIASHTQNKFEFTNAFTALSTSFKNTFMQSPLGSGKTEHAHLVATERVKKGGKVFFISFLRSVIAQNNRELNKVLTAETSKKSVHYNDNESERPTNLEEIGAVCTTVQGLLKNWIQDLVHNSFHNEAVPPLLIIDEFSQVSSALCTDKSVITGEERAQFLNFLHTFKELKGQILALDGNITPSAARLANELGLEFIRNTYTPYPCPSYQILEAENGGTPYLNEILLSVGRNEKAVVACSSRRSSQIIYRQIKEKMPAKRILLLNRETTSESAALAFIEDPESEILGYDCVIYSPVLGAGFSVKHTQVRAFAIVNEAPDSRICPTSIEQLTRRFRNLHDNKISLYFKKTFGGNKITQESAYVYSKKLQADLAKKSIELVDNDDFQGFLAEVLSVEMNELETYCEAMISHDYKAALEGHLKAAGYSVTSEIIKQDKLEIQLQKEELTELSDQLKEEEIERVSNAQLLTVEEARHLQTLDVSDTPDNAAMLTRRRIENSLVLNESDYTEDKTLKAELVEKCLNGNFEAVVKRLLIALADLHNVPFDAIDSDTGRMLIDKKHLAEQAAIFKKILELSANGYDGEKAISIIESVRDEIVPKRHDLLKSCPIFVTEKSPQAALYRADLIDQDEFEKSYCSKIRTQEKRVAVRWLNDLLETWGFDIQQKRSKSANRSTVRTYAPVINSEVQKYAMRRLDVALDRALYMNLISEKAANEIKPALQLVPAPELVRADHEDHYSQAS